MIASSRQWAAMQLTNLKYLSSLYEVPVDYLLKEDSEMKNNPDNEPTPDKIQSKRKKAVIIAIAFIGILAVGIFGYFLTCNNEKCIDVADAESDQWNESQTEIEIDW